MRAREKEKANGERRKTARGADEILEGPGYIERDNKEREGEAKDGVAE